MWFRLTDVNRDVELASLALADGAPLDGTKVIAGDVVQAVARLTTWTSTLLDITIGLSAGASVNPGILRIDPGGDSAGFRLTTLPTASGPCTVSVPGATHPEFKTKREATIQILTLLPLQGQDGNTPLSGPKLFAGDKVIAVAKLSGPYGQDLQVKLQGDTGLMVPASVQIDKNAVKSLPFAIGTLPTASGNLKLNAALGQVLHTETIKVVALSPLVQSTDLTPLSGAIVLLGETLKVRAPLSDAAPRAASLKFKDVDGLDIVSPSPIKTNPGVGFAEFELKVKKPGIVKLTVAIDDTKDQTSTFTATTFTELKLADGITSLNGVKLPLQGGVLFGVTAELTQPPTKAIDIALHAASAFVEPAIVKIDKGKTRSTPFTIKPIPNTPGSAVITATLGSTQTQTSASIEFSSFGFP
jgi:hypothetical protein